MLNYNRKGISDVVATVLIVGLTVGAVAMIWSYISVLTGDLAELSPEISCFEIESEITDACFNSVTEEIEITTKVGINDEIDRLSFQAVDDSGISESMFCGSRGQEQCGTCSIQGKGQVKTFYMPVQNTNLNEIFLFANNCGSAVSQINIRAC